MPDITASAGSDVHDRVVFDADKVCPNLRHPLLAVSSDHCLPAWCLAILHAMCNQVDVDWVLNVTKLLLSATERGITAAQEVLPHTTAQQILEALYEHVRKEPTVVDVSR